jgi:hypothetical protein
MRRLLPMFAVVVGACFLTDSRARAQAPPAVLPPPHVVPLPRPPVTYFSGPGVAFYSSPKGGLFYQVDLPSTVYPAGYGTMYFPGFVSSYLGLGIFRPRGYQFNYRQGGIVPPGPFLP